MTANLILIWLFAYVMPAAAACGISALSFRAVALPQRNIIVMHIALLVSILASQYAIHSLGFAFPWRPDHISLLVLAVSAGFAFSIVGMLGLWYAASSFVQELTTLSIAFLLMTAFPVYAAVLLIAPVFVACHFLSFERWRLRVSLFTLWGVVSVLLFSIMPNVYLIAALHTFVGTVLISRSVLYPKPKEKSPV